MRNSIAFAACASLLSGCAANFDETTLVRVRHPSSVLVGVATPSGPEWLVDADGPPREAEIPATKPPFTELIRYAVAARRATGDVTVTCPSCGGVKERTVVPLVAPIELHGSPSDTLVWRPDALGMRFGYEGLGRCRKGRGECPREVLSLWLGTPATNVVEIRHRKVISDVSGHRLGAWAETIVGSLFLSAGVAILAGYSVDEGRLAGGPLVLGSWFVVGGSLFVATGMRGLFAKDSETTVYRAK